MMKEIKDLNEGDIVRIRGVIYKVKSIEKSPWILETGVDIFNFNLEYIEDDFGEKLANLVNCDEFRYSKKGSE